MKMKISIALGSVIVLGFGAWWVSTLDSNGDVTTTNSASNTNIALANVADQTTSCTLPVTEAPEIAARYGVPEGWLVEIENGTLAIMEDDRNLTTAFVYTAKLELDISATGFTNAFGTIFKTAVTDAGGTFAMATPTEADGAATAMVTASVVEGDLQGVFQSVKDADFMIFTAYWAPVNEFAAKEVTLLQVLDCYSRFTTLTDAQLAAVSQAKNASTEQPTVTTTPWGALVSSSEGSFSYQAPASWIGNASAAGESTGLTLDSPDGDASVAFLVNLGRAGAADPSSFAQTTMLVTYGIQATLSNGRTVEGASVYDFEGRLGSKPVRGAVAVKIEPYLTFFAHYLGVMIANAAQWGTYAPTLSQIQSSIRLTDAGQQLSSLPALPNYDSEALFGEHAGAGSSVTSGQAYKEAVEDEAAQKWADGMRGYEETVSPSTGDHYDVPTNSWNTTGPNGAGYYRQLPGGGLEQLQPITQ